MNTRAYIQDRDGFEWHIIDRSDARSVEYVKERVKTAGKGYVVVREDIGFLPMPDTSQCLIFATKSGKLKYRHDMLQATPSTKTNDHTWIRHLLTRKQFDELRAIAKRLVLLAEYEPAVLNYLHND
jgi:hypothetical protein